MSKLPVVIGLAALVASTTAFANDVDPFGFEKGHFISDKSRAEVVSELQAAQTANELPLLGDRGMQFIDAPSTRSRAQVVAETLEAKRLGLITYGDMPLMEPTAEQTRQIETAGSKALEQSGNIE